MNAFNLGYHTFFKQHTLSSCPFLEDSDEEDAWYRGWLSGEKGWEGSCNG